MNKIEGQRKKEMSDVNGVWDRSLERTLSEYCEYGQTKYEQDGIVGD